MPTPPASAALAQFMTATAGRNMTKAAYVAVATGIAMMILLTVDPAYQAAYRWIDALLWACLVFFIFEWVVRLRHAVRTHRGLTYALSGRGLVDAAGAAAVPVALVLGVNSTSAWLLGCCGCSR
jgi:voltage-gated potassium channel